MKVHKRKKSSRYRGTHTHGRGFKKKARGQGHRGGRGMAGIWKHKKSRVINLEIAGLIPRNVPLRRGVAPERLNTINLSSIEQNLFLFVKKGIAKESKGVYELNLEGYKVLGDGEIHYKVIIKASAASKSAAEKVKKAGGSIEIKGKPVEENKTKVKEEVKPKVKK